VDVIHTNGYDDGWSCLGTNESRSLGVIINHYGTLKPLGTVDFYPNYGYQQPDCKSCQGRFYVGACEECHSRAIDMFIWSISNPGKFKTNSMFDKPPDYKKPVKEYHLVSFYLEMGYYAETTSESYNGTFYLKTESSEPWIKANA
jgi:hypothetical protein